MRVLRGGPAGLIINFQMKVNRDKQHILLAYNFFRIDKDYSRINLKTPVLRRKKIRQGKD